jgi:hypothetical protein
MMCYSTFGSKPISRHSISDSKAGLGHFSIDREKTSRNCRPCSSVSFDHAGKSPCGLFSAAVVSGARTGVSSDLDAIGVISKVNTTAQTTRIRREYPLKYRRGFDFDDVFIERFVSLRFEGAR